jgi:hypothetical protein
MIIWNAEVSPGLKTCFIAGIDRGIMLSHRYARQIGMTLQFTRLLPNTPLHKAEIDEAPDC